MKCKSGYKKSGNKCARISNSSKKKSKSRWGIILLIIAIATVIDLFVPDPVPFIDEIALIFVTLFSLYKYVGLSK